MFLIQVPAPELLVIFSIREIPVNGSGPITGESFRRGDQRVITRTEEGGDRHSRLISVGDGPVPHTPVSSIAQCLHATIDSRENTTASFSILQGK